MMRHSSLCCMLTIVLIGGVSGCAALSGLGARQEMLAEQTLPPGLPARAVASLERLIGGGEIWTLKQEEVGGRTLYDITARIDGKDVRFEIASDGTVVAAGERVLSTSPLGGIHGGGLQREEVLHEVEGKGDHPVTLLGPGSRGQTTRIDHS